MHAELLDGEIEALGPWFHNLHLPDGRQTAPDHALGDFPSFKWDEISQHIPADLSGWHVLDIGCNAGFYTFKLAGRGARVTAIDSDPIYLGQARWAAEQFDFGDRVEFREMQIYDLIRQDDTYDLIWFMGVLYHLRHPLLALDIVRRKARKLMVLQTMSMPGEETSRFPEDMSLEERDPHARSRVAEDGIHRTQITPRHHQLVGAEPRVRGGYGARERVCGKRKDRPTKPIYAKPHTSCRRSKRR